MMQINFVHHKTHSDPHIRPHSSHSWHHLTPLTELSFLPNVDAAPEFCLFNPILQPITDNWNQHTTIYFPFPSQPLSYMTYLAIQHSADHTGWRREAAIPAAVGPIGQRQGS